MTNWRLVVNLVFLLLLLLTAREQWFARATAGQIERRTFRRDVLAGMLLFVGLLAVCSLIPRLMSEETFAIAWTTYIVGSLAWVAWRNKSGKHAGKQPQ